MRRRNLDHAGKQDDKDALSVLNNFHFMIDFRLCAFLGYCMKLPFGHVSYITRTVRSSYGSKLYSTVVVLVLWYQWDFFFFFLWIPFRFECFNDFLYKKSTDTFKTTHYLQQYRTTCNYVIIVPSRVLLSILIVQPLRQDTSSAYVVSYCSKVLYYLIIN